MCKYAQWENSSSKIPSLHLEIFVTKSGPKWHFAEYIFPLIDKSASKGRETLMKVCTKGEIIQNAEFTFSYFCHRKVDQNDAFLKITLCSILKVHFTYFFWWYHREMIYGMGMSFHMHCVQGVSMTGWYVWPTSTNKDKITRTLTYQDKAP